MGLLVSDCFDVSASSMGMPHMYCLVVVVGPWSADWLMLNCSDVLTLDIVMLHMHCVMAWVLIVGP